MAAPPRPRISAWPRGRDAGAGSGLEPLGPEEHRDSRGHWGWPGHPGPPEPVCRETCPVFPRSVPAPATETGRRAGGQGCPLRPGRPAKTSLWAAGSARPSAPCVRLWPAGSTSPCAVRRSGLSKDRRNESTAKPGEERSARRVTGVSTGGHRRAGRAQAGSRGGRGACPSGPRSRGGRGAWPSGPAQCASGDQIEMGQRCRVLASRTAAAGVRRRGSERLCAPRRVGAGLALADATCRLRGSIIIRPHCPGLVASPPPRLPTQAACPLGEGSCCPGPRAPTPAPCLAPTGAWWLWKR